MDSRDRMRASGGLIEARVCELEICVCLADKTALVGLELRKLLVAADIRVMRRIGNREVFCGESCLCRCPAISLPIRSRCPTLVEQTSRNGDDMVQGKPKYSVKVNRNQRESLMCK